MKKALFSILLLLGLGACVYCETCPSHEDVYPCDCEEDEDDESILIACHDDPNTLEGLQKILKSLTGKENVEIELDGLNLGKVPSAFFSGIGVTRLHISHCELDRLTSEEDKPLLSGLEDTLEELEIYSSLTEDNLPAKLTLGHLTSLVSVDLSYNTISELSNDWFKDGPSSLEYVVISNNGIEKLGDKAFANLPNLDQISIDGNRFGNVQRSMFPSSAQALTTLELDNNALESIPEDIFTNMPSLSHVSLRENGIAKLEENTWKPIWEQLDIIYLEGNPLQCDSHMNWMFDFRVTSAIYGTCESPREQKGKDIQDFIDGGGE